MKTYKLGNRAKCIIRAYAAGQYGDTLIKYDNQPYTILKDINATLNFSSYEKKNLNAPGMNLLGYYIDFLDNIYIGNVKLTDKILKLIYCKSEDKLCSVSENFTTDDGGRIYFNANYEKIYQVFVYNCDGELETAMGEYDLVKNNYSLTLEQSESSYVICYSYLASTLDLNRMNNYYVTLDFEFCGNKDDDSTTYWLHIDKCVLSVNKTLTLDSTTNNIGLVCNVINDKEGQNYLIVGN